MFLLKLYWTKWESHKSSKLVKVDNKVLIYIKAYFIFILVIVLVNNPLSGWLPNVLRLHIPVHLIPFTIHVHLPSTHQRLQSHDNKLNTAFGAGKPLFQIHNTNPLSHFHPWSSRSGISGDCSRHFLHIKHW